MSRFGNGGDETPPTRLIRNKDRKPLADQAADDTAPTRLIGGAGSPAAGSPAAGTPAAASGVEEKPTLKVNFTTEAAMDGINLGKVDADETVPEAAPTDAGKTVFFRPSQQAEATAGGAADTPAVGLAAGKPVVAWLVIQNGAGCGHSIPFSYGLNKIGRGADQSICLNFGDDQISRSNHAAIEFDPKTRAFYLSKGDNLVYHNGERVGTGTEKELKQGDQIELGETLLRFVPFCSSDFDWND